VLPVEDEGRSMYASKLRLTSLSALLVMTTVVTAAAQSTVVVVRHAEKADQSADPWLSDAGKRRAERLADMLRDTGVTAI